MAKYWNRFLDGCAWVTRNTWSAIYRLEMAWRDGVRHT